jgi:uncharacterized membrane protein
LNAKTFVLCLALVNLCWCAGLLLAPLSLPAGTVTGLNGHANVIDYPERWAKLPLLARAVYTFGDLNCHQMASRSWSLGGNQIPVDVRMLAGFWFGNLGFALVLRVPTMARVRDEVAQIVPARLRAVLRSPRRRMLLLVGLAGLAFAPAFLDVMLQILTSYESTNVRRFVTGAVLGVGGGFLVGAMFDSLLWRADAAPRSGSAPQ